MTKSSELETSPESVAANGSLSDRVQALRLPARVDAGKAGGRGSWLPWLLCLLLVGIVATLGVKLAGRAKADAQTKAASAPKAADAKPTIGGAEVVLESKGYIIPAHQIQVSPVEVSGRVIELNFEEGKIFKQGDVLARLDDTSYRADLVEAVNYLKAAEARLKEIQDSTPREVAQAKARLAAAQAKLLLARQTLAREEALMRQVSGSEEKYQQALADRDQAEQQLLDAKAALELLVGPTRKQHIAAAQFEVAQAQARLDRAQWRLKNCTIVAPIAGTILTKKAEIGNLVSPLSFNVSASVCEMADLSQLEVDLGIQERDIAKVHVGQKCQIRSDAYPDRPYKGEVVRLMPIANRAKAEVPVRVRIEVPPEDVTRPEGPYLRPEMGAVVSFLKKEEKQ